MRQYAAKIWRRVYAVVARFYEDEGWFLASGIAFQAFFALCPIVLLAASLIGVFYSDETSLASTLSVFKSYLPDSNLLLLGQALRGLAEERAALGLTGVIALLWSGRCLFMALELSLQRIWRLKVRRSSWRSNVAGMASALLAAAATLLLMLVSGFISSLQVALSRLPFSMVGGITLDEALFWSRIHSWILVPVVTCIVFCALYSAVPRGKIPWRQVFPGALFSALGWRVTSWIYIQIIWEFGSRSPLYGSLWGVVGFLLWLYLEACVFLLGAEMIYLTGRLTVAMNEGPISAPFRVESHGAEIETDDRLRDEELTV